MALTLAQIECNPAKQLLGNPAESLPEYGRAQIALATADAQVNEDPAEVYQARACLGLPAQPTAFFLQQTADPIAAQRFAWQKLENLRSSRGRRLLISTALG